MAGETENPEIAKVEKEVEAVTEEVEKQEVKVEEASDPAEKARESDKLDALHAKFDTLVERLNAIDKRLAEPTVPAPEAKPETPVVDNGESPVVSDAGDASGGKPKKRRLGAWS